MTSVQGMLYVPILNPMRFHQFGLGAFWEDEIPSPDYQSADDVRYCQKYTTGDILYLQFLADFNFATGATVTLIDNDGNLKTTYTPAAIGTVGALDAYEVKGDFTDATTAGMYFLKIAVDFATGSVILYSEPLHIDSSHDDTIVLSYRHEFPIHDCIFGGRALPTFHLRVEGGLKSDGFTPAGKFTQYTDLDYQPVILQSQPFSLYKYTFGNSRGVPNWMADRINRAFSVDVTLIDNIQYMRNEGAKMERNGESIFPRAGWTLELLKARNDYSERFSGGDEVIHDGVWDDDAIVDDDKIFSND